MGQIFFILVIVLLYDVLQTGISITLYATKNINVDSGGGSRREGRGEVAHHPLNFALHITNLTNVPLEDVSGLRSHTLPPLNGFSGSATGRKKKRSLSHYNQ